MKNILIRLCFGLTLLQFLSFCEAAQAQETELIYACENCGFEYLLPLDNDFKVALFKRNISNATLAVLDKQNLITDSLTGHVEVARLIKYNKDSFVTTAGYIGGLFTLKDADLTIDNIIKVSGGLIKQKELNGYSDYFSFGDHIIIKSLSPRKGKGKDDRRTKVGYFHWDDLPANWEHDVFTDKPSFYGGRIPEGGFVNLQYHKNPEAIRMHNTKIQWLSEYKPWTTLFNAKNSITIDPNTQTAYFLNGHQNGEISYFTKQEDGSLKTGFITHDINTKRIEFLQLLCDFYTGVLYAVVRNPDENNRKELWEINVRTGKSKPEAILRDFEPYHIEGRRMYYVQKKDGLTAAYRVSF